MIHLPNDVYPRGQPQILRSPGWLPDETHRWELIEASPPEGSRFRADTHTLGNALLVADLLEAIEQNRKPVCSEQDGRWTIEMITSVYQSQKTGARVTCLSRIAGTRWRPGASQGRSNGLRPADPGGPAFHPPPHQPGRHPQEASIP